jgi:hypothetical protein
MLREKKEKINFINQRKIKKENKQTILTATICYSSPSPRTPTTPKTPTTPGGSKNGPLFSFTDPTLAKKAATVKEQLLQWAQMKTKAYEVERE